jgi:hypothetical protein
VGKVVTYRDLDAWKVGMIVAEQTYALSASLPAAERYALCVEMRRASVSIPSNIAEGQSRGTAMYLLMPPSFQSCCDDGPRSSVLEHGYTEDPSRP